MKEVMEQSGDKVLENALANGGESHTSTHAESVNYLIEKLATGHMHIAIKNKSCCTSLLKARCFYFVVD